MQKNKKAIFLCFGILVILIAVLGVKGFQKNNTSTVNHGTVDELVSVVTADSVSATSITTTPAATTEKPADCKKKKMKETMKPIATSKVSIKNTKSPKRTKSPAKKTPMITPKSTQPGPTIAPTLEVDNSVTVTITCSSIINKKELWKDGLEEIIPKDGSFYKGTVSISGSESCYDILKEICETKNIILDSQYTPLYGTYYIRGIGNLYEFDCGDESGWKYSVNGSTPGVGSSNYMPKAGDNIVFYYDYKY